MDVVTLGMAKAYARRQLPSPNIGTRVFGGRMGTFNNSTPNTFHIALETAQHFDAVRLILANTQTQISDATVNAAVSVMADRSDLNNSAGTWVTVSRGGLSRIPTALAPGTNRIGYTVTDWAQISSLTRTDDPTKPPILAARVYMSPNGVLPVYGNGTDSFTNWATRTDGRMWLARNQAVDGVGTPANFTSTTNVSQSPIVGVQYAARGKVVSVMAVGDSITEGRGTYLNEGFVLPACEAISNRATVAVEYSNCGWSGQTMAIFSDRAQDLLESDIKPDILVMPTGSPNDFTGTLTAANIASAKGWRSRVIACAQQNGVRPVLWTWLPTNTAVRAWGTSDALRVADNADALAMAPEIIVADTAAAVSGVTTGGQVQITAGSTDDDIHPNDTGNAALKTAITPALRAAIGA